MPTLNRQLSKIPCSRNLGFFFLTFTVSAFVIQLLFTNNYVDFLWQKTESSTETNSEHEFNLLSQLLQQHPLVSNIDELERYVFFDDNRDSGGKSNSNSNTNADKKMCGRYWIYENLGLVLVAMNIPKAYNDSDYMQPSYLYLTNINANHKLNPWESFQNLTIFVSIHGTLESYGGIAQPVLLGLTPQRMVWKFPYIFTIDRNECEVILKYVYWNGHMDINMSRCDYQREQRVNVPQSNTSNNNKTTITTTTTATTTTTTATTKPLWVELYRVPQEWKFYDEVDSCCEMCTRVRDCDVWHSLDNGGVDRCVLYQKATNNHLPAKPAKLSSATSSSSLSKNGGDGTSWFKPESDFVAGYSRHEKTAFYLGDMMNVHWLTRDCYNQRWDRIYGSGKK
ncbi:hypothetical protein RFI_36649, partial [Reticulomyxa filosa]